MILPKSWWTGSIQGHDWLGLAGEIKLEGIEAKCKRWPQKIASASDEQAAGLLRHTSLLSKHLECLIERNPNQCLDVIDALESRVSIAAWRSIQLQAADKLSGSERGKEVIIKALRSKPKKLKKRAVKACRRELISGAKLEGLFTQISFYPSPDNWLGLVEYPASLRSVHGICSSWEQKIESATEEQISSLMKKPTPLYNHLECLLGQDAEMCLDIFDTLSLRGVTVKGQLLTVFLRAALELFNDFPRRAEKLADLALSCDDDYAVLELVADLFERCGRDSEAVEIRIGDMMV